MLSLNNRTIRMETISYLPKFVDTFFNVCYPFDRNTCYSSLIKYREIGIAHLYSRYWIIH